MLSIRARNPPDRDIADVLRKFKVSFNLLVSSFIIVHNFLSVVMYIFSDGRDHVLRGSVSTVLTATG